MVWMLCRSFLLDTSTSTAEQFTTVTRAGRRSGAPAYRRAAGWFAAVVLISFSLALGGPARAACSVTARVSVPVTSIDGHVMLVLSVNGTDATFVLDTGAERTLMSEASVRSLGLERDQWVASTMLGVGGYQERPNALPRSLQLGGLTLRRRTVTADTSVTVGTLPSSDVAGRTIAGLLGRDFLAPFDLDLDLPAGRLTLYDVQGCSGEFLPWTTPYAAIPVTMPTGSAFVVQLSLDGHPLRALLDSGATASLVTLPGIRRLGMNEGEMGSDPASKAAGVGPRQAPMRLHRFRVLRVGPFATNDPLIWVAPVRVVPIVDMLLGADWLTPRHVWLSFATKQVFVAGR